MRLKKALGLAAVILLLAVVAKAAEREVLEAILIRVNDRIVTLSDFRLRLLQELSQRPDQLQGEELKRYSEGLLENLVDELILLERAQEKQLTVDDAMVDSSIQALREENSLQDDQAFKEALASSGLTEEDLRKRYHQSMLLSRVVQSEVQPAEITAEEVRQLYEKDKERFRVPRKVRLEQLFFPVADDGSDRDAVRSRINGLLERVHSGADLIAEATLAGSEVQELGAIPEHDLRPELADVLVGLDDGGMTEPLLTAGGFQVIRLLERIPAGYQPFDEVSEQLRRQLSSDQFREQSEGLVKRLRSNYLVEVHRDLLDRVMNGLVDG